MPGMMDPGVRRDDTEVVQHVDTPLPVGEKAP